MKHESDDIKSGGAGPIIDQKPPSQGNTLIREQWNGLKTPIEPARWPGLVSDPFRLPNKTG
jgi:hypothetical protein